MEIISLPQFGLQSQQQSYGQIKKELKNSVSQISYTELSCRQKYKNEKNYKPIDLQKLLPHTTVNVYSIKKHLELFLENQLLSSSLVFESTYNGEEFGSFTSGLFFHEFRSKLPDGVLPLCCTSI